MTAPPILHAKNRHLKTFSVLAKAARETAAALPPDEPLRRIAVVGAHYNPKKGFSAADKEWVKSAFDLCRRKGIAIASDFEIVPLNLKNGHDFLDPALGVQADMVVVCYVPAHDAPPGDRMPNDSSWMSRSPRAAVKDVWREAALRAGARLVVTYRQQAYKDVEVNARDFIGADYVMGVERYKGVFVQETAIRRTWQRGMDRLML